MYPGWFPLGFKKTDPDPAVCSRVEEDDDLLERAREVVQQLINTGRAASEARNNSSKAFKTFPHARALESLMMWKPKLPVS